MYDWRKMSQEERQRTLANRRSAGRPWHSPPHRFPPGAAHFIISAACFEHRPIIGRSTERMESFAEALLELCDDAHLYAWCVLPNHYHLVVETAEPKHLMTQLGQLHGRTSYEWNGQEASRKRQVWYCAVEREIRSEAHLWASINYVHHNPVKHGYATRWQDWIWSSAGRFLETVGRDEAQAMWQSYPVLDYGKGWDE